MDDDEITAGKVDARREYVLEEVFGIIPALPGVETGDFDDLIEEVMEDHADWVVDRMRRGLE
jgi:hypothetical protein